MHNKLVNIIFSINTGRSGSSYISSLLKGFENVESFHEPQPSMCEKPMKNYQLGNTDAFRSLLRLKVEKIQAVLERGHIYFESNHYFIKGFGWEIVKKLPQESIGIVIIKRNSNDIINSFFMIGVSILGNGAVMHLINPFSQMVSEPFYKNKFLFSIKLFAMRLVVLAYNIPFFFRLRKRKNLNIFEKFQKKYLKWYIEQYEYLKQKFIAEYPELFYLEIDINAMTDDEIISLFQEKFAFQKYTPGSTKRNSAKERLKGK